MTVLDEIAPIDPEVALAGKEAPTTLLARVALVLKRALRLLSFLLLGYVIWNIRNPDYIVRNTTIIDAIKIWASIGYPLYLPFAFSWWGTFRPVFYLISAGFVAAYFSPLLIPGEDGSMLIAYSTVIVWPILTLIYLAISLVFWGQNVEKLKAARK